RELSRVVRDLLVVSVDATRLNDPEIADEGERDRLKALAGRYSREDLLRAFDLLTKAETDIRGAAQPRYHLEMALLRWIYLRKLTPIEDLIAGAGGGPEGPATAAVAPRRAPASSVRPAPAASAPAETGAARAAPPANFKDALLAEIRKVKEPFYGTVCAQAQRIDVTDDRVTFTFLPNQRWLQNTFDQNRSWLESVAQKLAGRRMAVAGVQAEAPAPPDAAGSGDRSAGDAPQPDRKSALREQALADAGVQAMLEVFPAEIRDVEEM